jgi:hypothetical protein
VKRPLNAMDWMVAIILGIGMAVGIAFVVLQVPESPISACGTDCVMDAAEGRR